MNLGELVTTEELANYLHLRPPTIRLWAREGIIPAIHITGRVVRYDAAEVEKALRQRSAERQAKRAKSRCA